MAMIIKYKLQPRVTPETENNPIDEKKLPQIVMGWNEMNENIAKKEAYKGEYTIEDDGQPDPSDLPTRLDTIEAQVAYTAMMTDTLLPEV